MKTLRSFAKRQFMIEFIPAAIAGFLAPIALLFGIAYRYDLVNLIYQLYFYLNGI